ncbi:hypothetical protein [Curtobacterium sp. Arg-1]|uniref:hypothetical protein n=1 Tax=Curtobacterium sp. Arg-1 TaxID=2935040 RepID=UPI0021D83BCD|nr:hypothetical protein [Curtobacterium sp. Arg-1]UXZ57140.1 hypothetical protein MXD64_14210 [Curtobacterium sp. Arg-1]
MDIDDSTRLVAKRLRAALREAGMSVPSLYRKLRGERHITFTELVHIAVLTERHPSSFLRNLDA